MNIGPERNTGMSGLRPSIRALDSGRVVVASDTMNAVRAAIEDDNGFSVRVLGQSSKTPGPFLFNASRLYVTSLATDGAGWVCAWRCGIKEWGLESVYGPAVSNGSLSRSVAFTKGAARVAWDKVMGCYVALSKDGACLLLTRELGIGNVSKMPIGSTGEKLAFAISPNGKRHSVMSGFSKQGASYVCTGMAKWVEWAAYSRYPDMSPDENYPAIGLYGPNKALVACVYGGELRYNIVKGGVPQHNPADLPTMGAASKSDRCAPSLVRPGRGSVWAFWRLGSGVRMGRPGVASTAVCEGSDPAACWNAARGCISLAYVKAGAVWVREVRL